MTTYKILKTRQGMFLLLVELTPFFAMQRNAYGFRYQWHEIKGQIVEAIESCLLIWKKK